MKKLGIIGGAGPLASVLLYETIVYTAYEEEGSVPEICLMNYPFSRGLTLKESEQNNPLIIRQLDEVTKKLNACKVDVGVIACNTLHMYLPIDSANFPFFSLPKIILEEVSKQAHDFVLVLGTEATAQGSVYQKKDNTIIFPNSSQQKVLGNIIDKILKGEIYQKDSLIISNMIHEIGKEKPIKAVILGCTELPVLHHHHQIASDYPIYDSIKLPAKIIYKRLCGSGNLRLSESD